MRRFLRNNGLSVAMFGLFAVFLVGQSIAGMRAYNQDQQDHHAPTVSYVRYLQTGAFVEAVFENWESEFLQMGAYVLLTAVLFQKGASDSNPPDKQSPAGTNPKLAIARGNAPAAVRKGGIALKLYEHSLSLALFTLFGISFIFHAMGGARAYSDEQVQHGGHAVSTVRFVTTSQFWFESLQNWQSEFLSVGVLLVLSIVLRQQGSPESKSVDAPNEQTGDE